MASEMYRVERIFPATSTQKVREFEQRTGIHLPPEYVQFLVVVNGGRPFPNVFAIPSCKESALLDILYGLLDSREPCDLEYELFESRDSIQEGFLPIGRDPGGNQILLNTT